MTQAGTDVAAGSVIVTAGSGGLSSEVSVPAAIAGTVVAGVGINMTQNALRNMSSGDGKTAPNKVYERPNNATTKEQRTSVQDKPCVTCGKTEGKMYADHKEPLVKEHYEKGGIDKTKMRETDAVQPQCPTCSAKQGAEMSKYSKEQKKLKGFNN